MKTFYTKDKTKWFTDEEKTLINEAAKKSMGCTILNLDIGGLTKSIFASGYPMDTYAYGDLDDNSLVDNTILRNIELLDITEDAVIFKHPTNPGEEIKRNRKTIAKLASCEVGSGHDAFLKGIHVEFSLVYPVWLSPQIQRYSHIFYVSSTSAMQRITSMKDISLHFDPLIKDTLEAKLMQERISTYNTLLAAKNPDDYIIAEFLLEDKMPFYVVLHKDETKKQLHKTFTKEEFYHYIISLCPQGLTKTVLISTNALQLKNVINQRTFHKMPEWRYMTTVFKSLPIWKDLKVTFNKNKIVPIEEQK